jgi:hypothetical protein
MRAGASEQAHAAASRRLATQRVGDMPQRVRRHPATLARQYPRRCTAARHCGEPRWIDVGPEECRAMEGGPRRPARRVSLRASPAAAGEREGGFHRCGSADLLPFCEGRPSGTDHGFTIAPVPVGRPSGRRVAGRPAPERGAVAPFAWVGLQADTSPADLPPSARRSRRSRGSAFRPTPCRPGRYACTAHGRPERPAAGIPAGMRECGERRRPCDPCALLHSVRIGIAGPRAGCMRFGLAPLPPRK